MPGLAHLAGLAGGSAPSPVPGDSPGSIWAKKKPGAGLCQRQAGRVAPERR